jgi:hypothetical protein
MPFTIQGETEKKCHHHEGKNCNMQRRLSGSRHWCPYYCTVTVQDKVLVAYTVFVSCLARLVAVGMPAIADALLAAMHDLTGILL